MKKFRTRWDDQIESFEVVKETEKQIVFIKTGWNNKTIEERELKESSYHKWHNSFDEAKQYLINKQSNRIKSLEKQIEDSKRIVEKLNLMAEK